MKPNDMPTLGDIFNFLLKCFDIKLPQKTKYGILYKKEVQRFKSGISQSTETKDIVFRKIIETFTVNDIDNQIFFRILDFVSRHQIIIDKIYSYDAHNWEVLFLICKHFYIPYLAQSVKLYSAPFSIDTTFKYYKDIYSIYFGEFWYLPTKINSKIITPYTYVSNKQRYLAKISEQQFAEKLMKAIMQEKNDYIPIADVRKSINKREKSNAIPKSKTIEQQSNLELDYIDLFSNLNNYNYREKYQRVKQTLELRGLLQNLHTLKHKVWIEQQILLSLLPSVEQKILSKDLNYLMQTHDLFDIFHLLNEAFAQSVNPFKNSKLLSLLKDKRYKQITKTIRESYTMNEKQIVDNHIKSWNEQIDMYRKPKKEIIRTALKWARGISYAYKELERFFGNEKAFYLVELYKVHYFRQVPLAQDKDGTISLAGSLDPLIDYSETIFCINRELLKNKISTSLN